jgi:hypothetical protein
MCKLNKLGKQRNILAKRGEIKQAFTSTAGAQNNCDLKHDVAKIVLDPLAANFEAIRGPKYEIQKSISKKKLDLS